VGCRTAEASGPAAIPRFRDRTTKGVKRPRDAIQLGMLIVDIVSPSQEDEGALVIDWFA
jgi:hypothetical protein